MRSKSVVVVGSSNTDLIIKTSRIPAPGETIIGGEFITAPGGKGANQAVAAARLGAAVTFVAKLGTDDFGNRSCENFAREKIATRFVLRDKKTPSGIAIITVDSKGENSIVVASGSNWNLSPSDINKARKVIDSAGVLLMQLESPLESIKRAADIAYKSGAVLILNPAPARPLPKNLLKRVSILTPNESEISLLTGIEVKDEKSARKAGEAVRKMGVKTVIVTMGKKGALIVSSELVKRIPSKKIKAVDTTAAGDAFNGALAASLVREMPLEKAVEFANHVGALSATKMGAQPSLPKLAEIKKFMGG